MQQRRELAETKSTLHSLMQERNATRASDAHARLQDDLDKHQKRLQEITQQLTRTATELQQVSAQSSAREQELQKLIAFLKDEIKASEAQIELLQNALSSKLEVRKAIR